MQNLNDIVIPEAIAYVPQTLAWAIVFAILLTLVCGCVVAWIRHHRRNRYRKLALERLADIEHREAFAEIPVLVKQTALSFSDRRDVASLSGDAWLRFLDETYGGDAFTTGPGRRLLDLAYGRAETVDTGRLIPLVRRWILKHHVRV